MPLFGAVFQVGQYSLHVSRIDVPLAKCFLLWSLVITSNLVIWSPLIQSQFFADIQTGLEDLSTNDATQVMVGVFTSGLTQQYIIGGSGARQLATLKRYLKQNNVSKATTHLGRVQGGRVVKWVCRSWSCCCGYGCRRCRCRSCSGSCSCCWWLWWLWCPCLCGM